MDRRTFLAGASALTAATAGCSQLGGSDSADESDDSDGDGDDGAAPNREGDLGMSVTTAQGVEITYQKVVVTDTVLSEEYSLSKATTEDEKQFVLVKLQSRLTDDGRGIPDRDAFRLATSSTQYRPADHIGDATLRQPVAGDVYEPDTYGSSETSHTGWIPFSVPADTDTFELILPEAETEEEGDVVWEVIADAGDEVTFDLSTGESDAMTLGESSSLTITVENTGNKTGRFYRNLDVQYPGVSTDESTRELDYTLDAGATKELSLSVTPTGVGTVQVYDMETDLVSRQIEAPSLSFGETWTSPQGLELTVSDVTLSASTTYLDSGTEETTDAGSGLQFAFIHVTVTNPTTEERNVPNWDDSFQIDGPDSSYTNVFNPEAWSTEDWQEPVQEDWYGEDSGMESGGEETGVIPLKIPAELSKQDLTVVTNYQIGWGGPEIEVNWQSDSN